MGLHSFLSRSWFFAGSALCAAALVLGGCKVGPNYKRPGVESPARFRDASAVGATSLLASNSLADLPWWEIFKDPTLQELLQSALTNNYDLRLAVTRIEQAHALEIQAGSALLPQVAYGGEAERGRNMFLGLPTPDGGKTMSSFATGLGAAWEVDLWGRVRRSKEAANASMLASAEVRRGLRLMLVAGVARAYFELLELDERLSIARRSVDSFQRTCQLFTERHDNGLASRLELARARAALHSVAAEIPDLERQIALKENEINAYLGRNPAPVKRAARLLEQALPLEVPAGLPSALLERRPDIRQAEDAVRAANAMVGASIGDFFPRIGLTAVYGGVSTDLSDLTSATAGTWSLAANTTFPIFQGGRLYGRYKQAKAAYEQARLNYQETALQAFREVSDALVTRQKVEAMRSEWAAAVEAYRDAEQTATERYSAGRAGYYEVLEAQQQRFPAENALSRVEVARRLTLVQLYKALGGGWNLSDAQWTRSQGSSQGARKKGE